MKLVNQDVLRACAGRRPTHFETFASGEFVNQGALRSDDKTELKLKLRFEIRIFSLSVSES